MDPVGRWSALMALPEDRIPLDEAAMLLSAAADPSLDLRRALAGLDALAQRTGADDADGVCAGLFADMGFTGDTDTYDDPVNSYLDRVVARRRGIPITLSVLLVEVARRRGVTLEVVGMPGHVLVRDPAAPARCIDAFHGGRRLDRAGCEGLLREVAGPSACLTDRMLAAIGPRAVLLRMLANLDRSFARRGDHGALAWVSSMRVVVPGAPPADRAQLAGRLAEIGRWDVAAAVLEEAAGGLDAGPTRDRLLADAVDLRARLN